MTMERFPRGKTAIVSGATYGIGESPGQTSLDLAVSASLRALNAVGLKPSDVDGLFIGLPDDYLSGLSFAEYLGICPRLTDNNRTGGSSFQTHAIHAALALEAHIRATPDLLIKALREGRAVLPGHEPPQHAA